MPKDLFESAGNAAEIVGGAGRLCYAFVGQAVPTEITDVMDRTTLALKSGWKDFGFTMEGISISRSQTIEDIEVDQSYTAVDSRVTGSDNSLSTTLAQNTIEHRQISNMGATLIETPATYGTSTTTTAAVAAGATVVPVTAATGILAGSFIEIGGVGYQVVQVSGLNVILNRGLQEAAASAAPVKPITALKTKRVSYGSQNDRPALMIALITQRPDKTFLMILFYNIKVSGDDVEQTFSKETRGLPLSMKAYPLASLDGDSDIYIEIDERLS